MASETSEPAAPPPTVAEICQTHIDQIESATIMSSGAVKDAVLQLLYLTRNNDVAARANRAEIDRELERIRGESSKAQKPGGNPTFTVTAPPGFEPREDAPVDYAGPAEIVSVHQPLVDRAEKLKRQARSAISGCWEQRRHPRQESVSVHAFSELVDLVADLAQAVRDG